MSAQFQSIMETTFKIQQNVFVLTHDVKIVTKGSKRLTKKKLLKAVIVSFETGIRLPAEKCEVHENKI